MRNSGEGTRSERPQAFERTHMRVGDGLEALVAEARGEVDGPLLLLRAEDGAAEDGVDLQEERISSQHAFQVAFESRPETKTHEHSEDVLPLGDDALDGPEDLDGRARRVVQAHDGGAVVALRVGPGHLCQRHKGGSARVLR